jgi:hypothetical protein
MLKEELIDGCVRRTARKDYPCVGDGTPNVKVRKHHPQCTGIRHGDMYVEFEPQAVSAGSRHCCLCAMAFFAR